MKPKIIILPGNGNTDMGEIWFPWVREQLTSKGFEVIAENMPDPEMAHMNIWLPHVINKFKADQNTIIIGHSTGGVAVLRLLESHKLLGAIVIGVNHTDLGYPEEKESGYYDQPWQWGKMKANAQWIVQFCSQDDPYIPIKEPRYIHEQIDSEYHEFVDRGHFGSEHEQSKTFPELIEVIDRKTNAK